MQRFCYNLCIILCLSVSPHKQNFSNCCESILGTGNVLNLRQLRTVRRSLTLDARWTLATAFIASRVDYCNAVLSRAAMRRLETMMNAVPRMVTGCDNIIPVLCDVLDCLPVPQRIQLKIAFLAFNSIRGTGSAYFQHICIAIANLSWLC